MYGYFAPSSGGRFVLRIYFFSEQTQQCRYWQVKWNRNEIKENNIIQCKIIANSNISNIKSNTRLTSMTRKLHDIGRKFSQTWQDTVVSRRDFWYSWIKRVSNVILNPRPFNMKPPASGDWLHYQYKIVQPVVTDRKISYHQAWNYSTNGTTNRMVTQSVARPVARLVSPRSCAIDGTTLYDWSHDRIRPVCDLLRFLITGPEFWTWPSTLLRPNFLVRSPTTSKINHTICQRFVCDSSSFVVVYSS